MNRSDEGRVGRAGGVGLPCEGDIPISTHEGDEGDLGWPLEIDAEDNHYLNLT
jgi:hypothetical protein